MVLKDIKKIKEQVNEIKDTTDQLSTTLIKKAQKYDELIEQLKQIRFNVDKCFPFFDEKRLAYVVKVNYKINPIELVIDDDGEIIAEERFKIINFLDLIPLDDMQKIIDQIEVAKKMNKGGS